RGPGTYNETLQLPTNLPRGVAMRLILKAGGKVIGKFDLR
ncbi:MAG: hypothetical protein ACJAZ9_001296, partial [Neolewinella sp.]